MDIGMSGNSPIDREHDRGKGIASESVCIAFRRLVSKGTIISPPGILVSWKLRVFWILLGCPKATVAWLARQDGERDGDTPGELLDE